ncbi:hypothetical protein EV217_0774 [Phyllobacterium myrsinacearum]|nr:hypothetical protein EV217_0774 [Phyllobacterium myrsinacearum]
MSNDCRRAIVLCLVFIPAQITKNSKTDGKLCLKETAIGLYGVKQRIINTGDR